MDKDRFYREERNDRIREAVVRYFGILLISESFGSRGPVVRR